jgi:hypothetical protein
MRPGRWAKRADYTAAWAGVFGGWLLSCGTNSASFGEPWKVDEEPVASPDLVPATPVLRRLTRTQYLSAVAAVFGELPILPGSLEPDEELDGLETVGASVAIISPTGVERYEAAAFLIADQALSPGRARERWLTCSPAGVRDDGCAQETLAKVGKLLWRRPLSAEEQGRFVEIAGLSAESLGDFYEGMEFALAALMQAPDFLFRVEVGEEDPQHPGQRRLTDHELAARMAWFFWNEPPDMTVHAAVEGGLLATDEGIVQLAGQMMDDPRSRVGMRAFFTELLALDGLDGLVKDPVLYPQFTEAIGPSAREQTLLTVEAHLYEDDADYRDLFVTRRTFVDPKLASLYGVEAPNRDGFGEIVLPAEGGRRGLLGHISFLALQAHSTSSSATRRGIFIQERLLCHPLPPPPANVDTSIPEPSEDAKTLRDRVAIHLEDPACSSCHLIMDPLGLGLENFDALGVWRTTENGATIDASGELEGGTWQTPWELAGVIRDHADLGPCLTRNLYAYGVGRPVDAGEEDTLEWLSERFEDSEYSVRTLMVQIASSEGFRRLNALDEEAR